MEPHRPTAGHGFQPGIFSECQDIRILYDLVLMRSCLGTRSGGRGRAGCADVPARARVHGSMSRRGHRVNGYLNPPLEAGCQGPAPWLPLHRSLHKPHTFKHSFIHTFKPIFVQLNDD